MAGIIFSAESVLALLAGTKTQTRRVVKTERCPYGNVGDLLWVREAWGKHCGIVYYRADGAPEDDEHSEGFRWKPAMFMARVNARIELEITSVRQEYLQAINEEDAKAEGVDKKFEVNATDFIRGKRIDFESASTYRLGYKHAWDQINAYRGYPWNDNPLVWVIEFTVREGTYNGI